MYVETQAEKEEYHKAYKKKQREIVEDPMLKYFSYILFGIDKVARPKYILCNGEVTKIVFDTESQRLIDKIVIDRDNYIREKYR